MQCCNAKYLWCKVNSSWHGERSITQMPSDSCKVESDVTEASDSPPPQKTEAVYIKEEPEEGEDITVKEEPIDSNENEGVRSGQPAPKGASDNAAGSVVSAAYCSQHGPNRFGCSQGGFVEAEAAAQLQQCLADEQATATPLSWTATSVQQLTQHVRAEHKELYQCFDCECTSSSEGYLRYHILFQHPSQKPFRCLECDYSCVIRRDLRRHVLSTHSSARPYSCSACQYSGITESDLKRHVLANHPSEKPFRCSECECSCVTENDLRRHVPYKHSPGRPFICTECEYTGVTKSNLQRHVLSKHSSEKPFNCSQCSYSCIQRQRLVRHVQSKHSKSNSSPLNV
ncbi:gastrula zinc finger protein XlCGF17.1-like [Hyalella azteca]|uniref:Gastrula zinc finger protein XlCGF17.1-like n=1 Tax=Hyalella azteca TaxID=294128 RepID=A0A8B7NS61_HYAAZ|nr:gastrula zinc finger protein XlCGF17.1-like [Hyalella azteca]